jgi:hypothetical protein
MVTIIGYIKPCESLKPKTTDFRNLMERVLSSSQGQIKLGGIGVWGVMISDIAKRSVNRSSSARCLISKTVYTCRAGGKQHSNDSKHTLEE